MPRNRIPPWLGLRMAPERASLIGFERRGALTQPRLGLAALSAYDGGVRGRTMVRTRDRPGATGRRVVMGPLRLESRCSPARVSARMPAAQTKTFVSMIAVKSVHPIGISFRAVEAILGRTPTRQSLPPST